MIQINPMELTDFYKVGHPFQYPRGIEYVYSNFTPRKSRMSGVGHMVFFGLQAFVIEYLIGYFNRNFFKRPLEEVLAEYKTTLQHTCGPLASYEHIVALHQLGYLPVSICAVLEGTPVPMRVPAMTIVNTHPQFAWVTNFLETLMSASLWQACTSATVAFEYRKLFDKWAARTGIPDGFTQWQGHDFSFRGMSSLESAILSGMGHLLSFTGTDTIPAIRALETYYGADRTKELVGASIPATEHSVMCCGGVDGETETYRRLVEDVYPNGLVSIVSDTWDLWAVTDRILPALKARIMARNGKVVIRPDSGNPADIVCGTGNTPGVIERLWNVFGGTVTSTGHRLLDSHIGAIYGDSITIAVADDICRRLADKGFASQLVCGLGSFTYQYNTRDTFGTAIKSTWVQIDGKPHEIFKAPKTDDGTKNSAKGLLCVDYAEDGNLRVEEGVSPERAKQGLLQPVFVDGQLVRRQTLAQVRQQLRESPSAKLS